MAKRLGYKTSKKVEYDLGPDTIRLQQFRVDDPADLEAEIAIARLLLQDAYRAGNMGAGISVLNAIGSLVKKFEEIQVRRNDTLGRNALMRLAVQMHELIADDYKSLNIPDWEDRLNLLMDKLGNIVEGTVNTDAEVKALT